ncbi:HET domain containing protein [Hyaloscypha variabilis]
MEEHEVRAMERSYERERGQDAIFLQRLQELRARQVRRESQARASDPEHDYWESLLFKKTRFDYDNWHLFQIRIKFGERTGRQLRHSAASCQLCELTWSVVNKYQDSAQDLNTCKIHVDLLINHRSFKPEGVLILLDAGDDFEPTETLNLFSAEEADSHLIRNSHPPDSSSPEIWSTISTCLSTCLYEHKACREDMETTWLPTRLIDVGVSSEQSEPKVILSTSITTTNEHLRVNYLALSHRWGKSRFATLKKSSIRELERRIPATGLSQTFRDAISVCHRLCVRYLWIDSLCIIQDCADDWNREASMMAKVYQNSYCILAASEAEKPHQGLFRQRDTTLFTPLGVLYERATGASEHYNCLYDSWLHATEETPLRKRGWVLQEHRLSPRTIHFATPIIWECRELTASEAELSGISNGDKRKWPSKKIQSPAPRPQAMDLLDHECALTRPEDKLVAISGIARVIAAKLEDEYLGGIWRKYITNGLLWVTNSTLETREASRSVSYIAPSWSWASVDGPILPFWDNQRLVGSFIELIEAKIIPLAGDPFGQLTDGYLDVRGKIFVWPISLMEELHEKRLDKPNSDVDSINSGSSSEHELDIAINLDDPMQTDWSNRTTYFLPVAEVENIHAVPNCFQGLLLQKTMSQVPNPNTPTMYERIGIGAAIKNVDSTKIAEKILLWNHPPWPAEELETIRLV